MGLLDILFMFVINILQSLGKFIILVVFFLSVALVLLFIALAIYGVFFL